MERNEIVSRIVDYLLDPWTQDPEDYCDLTPITLEYATSLLEDYRRDEGAEECEPEDRLPEETTPELVMEAMNCMIQWGNHKHRINMVANWLTETENVCLYDQYRSEYLPDSVEVLPVDFLCDEGHFPFDLGDAQENIIALLTIGKLSARTFNPNHAYCWFDKDKWQLHSTNTPFADGVIDAHAFATYIVESGDTNVLNELSMEMDDDTWAEIFDN